jgi:hypothetical protein
MALKKVYRCNRSATCNRERREREIPIYWIWVLDELNGIFARYPPHLHKIASLDCPFNFINHFITLKNVTCVLSTNNRTSYKNKYESFDEFDHPIHMSRQELTVLHGGYFNMNIIENAIQATNGSPLQMAIYLKNPEEYAENAVENISSDLDLFLARSSPFKESIEANAVNLLLKQRREPDQLAFDQKYSVLRNGYFEHTYPAVLLAYRLKYWKQLMAKVQKIEAEVLLVCAKNEVTNDVREGLFELLVIARFHKQAASLLCNALFHLLDGYLFETSANEVNDGTLFMGETLPAPSTMKGSLFIPRNSNFPAIDLNWKAGQQVRGIPQALSRQIYGNVHSERVVWCVYDHSFDLLESERYNREFCAKNNESPHPRFSDNQGPDRFPQRFKMDVSARHYDFTLAEDVDGEKD